MPEPLVNVTCVPSLGLSAAPTTFRPPLTEYLAGLAAVRASNGSEKFTTICVALAERLVITGGRVSNRTVSVAVRLLVEMTWLLTVTLYEPVSAGLVVGMVKESLVA